MLLEASSLAHSAGLNQWQIFHWKGCVATGGFFWVWFTGNLVLDENRPLSYVFQAKPETVEKVIEIVTKQLAAKDGTVHAHSKFEELGADSLDQVCKGTAKDLMSCG